MSQIIEYQSKYGPILVEVSDYGSIGREKVSRSNVVKKAAQKFETALDSIKKIGDLVVAKSSEIVEKPDELTIELGIAFKAEAGAVIAKAASEGNLKVSLKWIKPKPETKLKTKPEPDIS